MDFTVAKDDHAWVRVHQAGFQAKSDTAVLHPFLRIMSERFAQLWQDALPRVHHNDLQFFWMQARIIRKNSGSKIVECSRQFDTGKSAAGDYKSQNRFF